MKPSHGPGFVGQVGSEALVPTVLIAGRDFRLDDKLRVLHREINALFIQQSQLELKLKYLPPPGACP